MVCKDHKIDILVDVAHKKCIICKKVQAMYGNPGKPAEYCSKCKLPGMINNSRKLCEKYKNKVPIYGINKATHCKNCKSDDMIDVVHQKCIVCKKKRPNFGIEDKKPTHLW